MDQVLDSDFLNDYYPECISGSFYGWYRICSSAVFDAAGIIL